MRFLAALIVAALSLVTAAHAAPSDLGPTAPIRKFVECFNQGDSTGAMATHARTADLVIMDEVPPYAWHGEEAFREWSAALGAYESGLGRIGQAVTLGAPLREETDGNRAYVVVPATYSFRQRGVAMRAQAQMAFVLEKGDAGWMIHGWTWSGAKALPAGSAKR
jgi:hypothetical protein